MGVLVVQGIAGTTDFTLANKSPIELPLIIDIRPSRLKSQNPAHIENLKLILNDSEEQLQVLGKTQASEDGHEGIVLAEGENLAGMEIDED